MYCHSELLGKTEARLIQARARPPIPLLPESALGLENICRSRRVYVVCMHAMMWIRDGRRSLAVPLFEHNRCWHSNSTPASCAHPFLLCTSSLFTQRSALSRSPEIHGVVRVRVRLKPRRRTCQNNNSPGVLTPHRWTSRPLPAGPLR